MKKPLLTKKRLLVLVGTCVVLVLLTLGLIGGFSSLNAYKDMKASKDLLFSAMDSLTKRDIESAARSFAQAREKSEKAASQLKAHKIGVGFLKIVPYVGTQVRALDSFTRIGVDLSQAGILLAGAMRGAPGLDAASPQQATMGTMVDVLTRLGNDMEPVEKELLAARKESDAMRTRWLIGRASRLKKELDDKLNVALGDVQKARKITAALSGIMGAPGQPAKNYMLLQQDCYELRASGGLIATYGILSCTRDSLKLADYQRAGNLVGLTAGEGVPPLPSLGGWMVSYGIAPNLNFWDAGWWPDFPLTTNIISKIWNKNGKAPVDGYIAVDPIAIGYVLGQIGPLQVPEFGETVTAENLSEVILKYKKVSKDHAAAFFKSLSARFFQKLVGSNPGQWLSLGRSLGQALDERHMLLYFNDPAVEKVFSELSWSGTVDQSSGDYLLAVDSNVGGNEQLGYKANLFIKPKMSVDIVRQKDSTLRHHVTYTLDNTSGTSDNSLRYKSYLRLFVPEDAVVKSVVAMAAAGLVETDGENGKRVFGRLVDVPIGQSVTVEFDYVTKNYGSLLIQKQPGIPNLDVSLIYMEGGSIRKAEELKIVNQTSVSLNK
jgi:hypothetical protein